MGTSKLFDLYNKKEKYVIGLMSGTSVDGIDAVLVKMKNNGTDTMYETLGFETYPFDEGVRKKIFDLFDNEKSSSSDICYMNFLLGELFAKASIDIATKVGLDISEIDLIGSHGQTIYHIPTPIEDFGYSIKSTLQIGDGCVIANRTGVVTVSDFRVKDMADCGQGAPLVPYCEYLIFSEKYKNIALLNLGGISNITFLPALCKKEDIIAFDTGPANMIIDFVISYLTKGEKTYDYNGDYAKLGTVSFEVIDKFLKNDYFYKPLPKTTGREDFGKDFSLKFIEYCNSLNLSSYDIVATATYFTAKTVALAIEKYITSPSIVLDELIVSGGGAYNKTLRSMLQDLISAKVKTQEDLGHNSDAKEAVAFAILANETISERESNLISVTGANNYKILGKISL
ncbi:MAG: anhydro-N-acetylmuramic acid kinase [Lachnospirales bacterium]